MTENKWLAAWQEKYSDVLASGLDGQRTYLVLERKSTPMLDVELRFKPFAMLSDDAIVIGGKLSVFPVKGTLKSIPINENAMVGWLLAAYPQCDFGKLSAERVGTTLVAAQPIDDLPWAQIESKMRNTDAADQLYIVFNKLCGVALDGPTVPMVKEALLSAFIEHLRPEADKLAAFTDNVLPFIKGGNQTKH